MKWDNVTNLKHYMKHVDHWDTCDVNDFDAPDCTCGLYDAKVELSSIADNIARKDELLRETMDFMLHDSECINAKWSAGRPTEDGGYEMKYGDKWYQTRPVDKTPKCECGVDSLIARIRKEVGE